MALHLEENLYPHLFNTIFGRAISCAIEKGMQDRLSAGIDHGKAGRSLEDFVTYNSSAEADYACAFQRLREVDFPLLIKLKSHKDTSTTDVMDLLRLEGETTLSFALNVTHSCVKRIRENVAAKRSALIGLWTPLVDPLSVENLIGEADTSDNMPITTSTTTVLSVTFSFASTVPPITIEDYKIMGTDGPEDAGGSGQAEASSFLNTIEFEKEELDTTLERDPPS
nr:hypothetical protein [Tanacetum cinerariifolium]